MKTGEFADVSPMGLDQLAKNFPFFFLIIWLIPSFYITTQIASEKESKAKEGMKMMGLTDSTYYLSIYINYTIIAAFVSIVCTVTVLLGVFT